MTEGVDLKGLSYDANGNITSRRLRDGNSIGFTFDALNRVTAKDLPGSEPDVTYSYDVLGAPDPGGDQLAHAFVHL